MTDLDKLLGKPVEIQVNCKSTVFVPGILLRDSDGWYTLAKRIDNDGIKSSLVYFRGENATISYIESTCFITIV